MSELKSKDEILHADIVNQLPAGDKIVVELLIEIRDLLAKR